MNTIIIITGQTATGKTRVALDTALKTTGELVNFDARQIYKHLDIITGKDTGDASFTSVRSDGGFDVGYYLMPVNASISIPIWLYDALDPRQPCSAHDFAGLVISVIGDIVQRGRTPILVGGSYFYLQYILYGSAGSSLPANWELRNELGSLPVEELQRRLNAVNPQIFATMNNSDRANPHRLIRRIEQASNNEEGTLTPDVYTISDRLHMPDIQIAQTGLRYADQAALWGAIERRVRARLDQGAVEECRRLRSNNYASSDPGLKTIGYQQIYEYLDGRKSLDEATTEWIYRERQYAKRQYTFMKRDAHIKWDIVA